MSLIRVRRDRRELGARVRRPMSPFRLILLLVLVGFLIWYIGQRF
jgi:hypothetical protein